VPKTKNKTIYTHIIAISQILGIIYESGAKKELKM